MRTLPAPVVIDTRPETSPERPSWVRFAVVFAAGALLGGIAVGVRGSSPTATTEAVAASVSTAVPEATTTTAEATTTTVEELIPLETVLRDAPFDSQTYVEDGATVFPVVFPDGTSMELLFPVGLALSAHGLNATTSGAVGDAPMREIALVPADIDDIDWPAPPLGILDGGAAEVRRYSAGEPAEGWLAFDFPGWTGLVADDPSQPMDAEEEAGWLQGLDAHTVPSGFIVLEASSPLRLAVAGEPGGPSIVIGEDLREVVIRTGTCPVGVERVVCVADTPVYFEIAGGANVAVELAGATRVRAFAPAAPDERATVLDGEVVLGALLFEDFEVTAGGTMLANGWPPDGMQTMLRSTDGGRTWMRQPLPDDASDQVTGIVALPGGGVLTTTTDWGDDAQSETGHLWRSVDDGLVWTEIDRGLIRLTAGVAGSGEVFVLGASCAAADDCAWILSKSSDGGESFGPDVPVPVPRSNIEDYLLVSVGSDGRVAVHGVVCDIAAGDGEVIPCTPFLATSPDGGTTWSQNLFGDSDALEGAFVARIALSTFETVFASGWACDESDLICDSELWVVPPDGPVHELEASATTPALESVHATRDGSLVGGGPGLFVSTDGGTEWSEATTPASVPGVFLGSLAEAPDGTLYAVGHNNNGFLWRSDDRGHTWVDVLAGE